MADVSRKRVAAAITAFIVLWIAQLVFWAALFVIVTKLAFGWFGGW